MSDLTEWYQTRNRLLQASRMSKKVCREASQLYGSQKSVPKFSKPLELRVVVLSGAIPSGLRLRRPERCCETVAITGHLVVRAAI